MYLKHALTAAVAAGSCLSVSIAQAEQQTDQLVVTATRIAQTADQSLVPVSVLTREDIERSPASSLVELLAQLPGVDFTQDGGPGKNSSLFLRGSNSSHTLMLIDGVKIGSATLGNIPFQDIPVEQIERIEVVRGPRSSLYGSEAIGGVIQIFTRKTTKTYIKAGAGNQSQNSFSAGIGSSGEQGSFSLSLNHYETDGIHSFEGKDPDRDGYQNDSLSLGLTRQLTEAIQLQFSALHIESNNHYDSFNYDPASHYDDQADNTQQTLALQLSSALTDNLDLKLGISQHRDESEDDFLNCVAYDVSPPFACLSYSAGSSQFETKRRTADALVDYYLTESQILTLGAEYRTDEVSGADYAEDERDNRALFGQWQAEYGALSLLAGLRHDDDQFFDSENTGNLNLGYQLTEASRVLAAYGTAFKAPTFNDLYYPFLGNPELNAETSESVELGYEYKQPEFGYAVRLFQTEIDNLIQWDLVGWSWKPSNVGKAKIEGVELEGSLQLAGWGINGSVSVLDPVDQTNGKTLQKRAQRTAQLSVARQFNKWLFNGSLLAQTDAYADAGNTKKMAGYAVANIKASYQLSPQFGLEAKVNNLFDKEYETNPGYNSLDRTYLLSLSYQH